jgi:tRNA threonylcarbamoyladenosine biosynthesis protein TsaB
MRILALETTDPAGSVAAIDGCNLLAELTLSSSQRSARSLAPAVKSLLEHAEWRPRDIQLVGVSVGPGSFTGLRVGVTTAKVFAYCVGAQTLGINTLEAIAAGTGFGVQGSGFGVQGNDSQAFNQQLCVAIDAQRGDVVVQSFAGNSPDSINALGPQELIAADAWLARLEPGTWVTGPALTRWADRLPPDVHILDRSNWFPRAAAVGLLAARYYTEGRRDDLWKIVPHYCRRSAAEEKWEAMGK